MSVTIAADMGLTAILNQLIDRKARVTLRSGTTFEGIIKSLGEHVLHVAQLDRLEAFDAVVELDEIVAVVYRA